MHGVLNILKPPGMTSHDVINYIRKLTGIKKAGHTGTLDPGAAGVLPVCLGKATKIAEYMNEYDKSYRGEITFGISTDTQDSFGQVIEEKDASYVTCEMLEKIISEKFLGTIEQIPPMVSAVRYQGEKLYELARKGLVVKRPSRKVIIHSFKLITKWEMGKKHPRILFDVSCSKGTYIRTLCADIGLALGCGAHLSFLLRTASGPFKLENAFTLEEIKVFHECRTLEENLVPVQDVLNLERVEVNPEVLKTVKNGNKIFMRGIKKLPCNLAPGQLVLILNTSQCLAVAKTEVFKDNYGNLQYAFQPEKVLV